MTGLESASWDMCNDAASWPDMSETGRSDAGHSDGRSDGSATLEQLFTGLSINSGTAYSRASELDQG